MSEAKYEDKTDILWRSPSSDFFSLNGLSMRTGCNTENLDMLACKELTDNALDACDRKTEPSVALDIECDGDFPPVKVADNGPGLSGEDVEKITKMGVVD